MEDLETYSKYDKKLFGGAKVTIYDASTNKPREVINYSRKEIKVKDSNELHKEQIKAKKNILSTFLVGVATGLIVSGGVKITDYSQNQKALNNDDNISSETIDKVVNHFEKYGPDAIITDEIQEYYDDLGEANFELAKQSGVEKFNKLDVANNNTNTSAISLFEDTYNYYRTNGTAALMTPQIEQNRNILGDDLFNVARSNGISSFNSIKQDEFTEDNISLMEPIRFKEKIGGEISDYYTLGGGNNNGIK